MILYNVTLKVDPTVQDEFMRWMNEEHVAEVLATGCFESCRMSQLLGQNDEDGKTYSLQYLAPSMKQLHRYQSKFAPQLQKKAVQKFGEQVLAYRTMMEVVKEFTRK